MFNKKLRFFSRKIFTLILLWCAIGIGSVHPFLPVLGSAVGMPIFGSFLAGGAAKDTVTKVNDFLFWGYIFLFGMLILVGTGLFYWLLRTLKKQQQKSKLKCFFALTARLHKELLLCNEENASCNKHVAVITKILNELKVVLNYCIDKKIIKEKTFINNIQESLQQLSVKDLSISDQLRYVDVLLRTIDLQVCMQ